MGAGKATAAAQGGWIVFEDESGQSLRPPKARTWGRRGITPVVRVSGKGSGRVNISGMVCYRPGHRSRLIYRMLACRGRKHEKKSFTWQDYRDLIVMAHIQLDGPIVLCWDNLNRHVCKEMKEWAASNNSWLTVFQLPSYAPELNPAEGIWSLIKRGVLANLAATGVDHLVKVAKHGLKLIQYRPHLVDGCLTETGLTIGPTPT